MSENKKLELLDQYDDVTFALLMDEYAEEEGARLRKEFEEAQAAGEVSDTSDALDEKCLQMIHRDFAKKRGKDNVRKIIKMTSKVAVAVMVFLGALTTTVMSVDALRVPVFNFFIEHFDGFATISAQDNQNAQNSDTMNPYEMLESLLPSDYNQIQFIENANMSFAEYESTTGARISLYIISKGAYVSSDTEGTEYSEVFLSDNKAILIVKNGHQLIWTDESGTTYVFRSSDLSKKQIIEICNTFATLLQTKR